MIRFTDAARDKFAEVIASSGEGCAGVRVRADKIGHHTYRYQLNLVREQDVAGEDQIVDLGKLKAYVDPETAKYMDGATINFISDESGSGFDIDNPKAKVHWDDPLAQKVQNVLDRQVGPALAAHGGWCELLEIRDGAAHVALGGGCQGCAGARATLKQGIEAMITREVPEITEVVDETDHGGGETPYM
jgi:Fe/S biogenesis protein NfuA